MFYALLLMLFLKEKVDFKNGEKKNLGVYFLVDLERFWSLAYIPF